MANRKKRQHVARINPNEIKSRDIVHMQEITHGTGTGAHKSKRDYNRANNRKIEKGWDSDPGPYHINVVLN